MNKKTIELPIQFFDSLIEYLDSCAKESALAARGIRAVVEKQKEPNTETQDTGEEPSEEQESSDNVLSFPETS